MQNHNQCYFFLPGVLCIRRKRSSICSPGFRRGGSHYIEVFVAVLDKFFDVSFVR